MLTQTKYYDYHLPSELIAKRPVSPRDTSKLLVYDIKKDKITHTTFDNLLDFVSQKSTFIFNNTKVIKARLYSDTSLGAKKEVLVNYPKENCLFNVLIKGKVKENTKIDFKFDNAESFYLIVKSLNEDGTRDAQFYFKDKILNLQELIDCLNIAGEIPIPPYMKRRVHKDDESSYQSLFASIDGSVAAPTASLHFTQDLINKIKHKHKINFITLHINAGTFKPIDTQNINEHKMHFETYEIPTNTKQALDTDSIIAVGTTAIRAIESYARNKNQNSTNLFLSPANPPKIVKSFITNFHLPKSTLIVLVASFIGQTKTMQIYDEAIKNKYRFYSYGDGMFIF